MDLKEMLVEVKQHVDELFEKKVAPIVGEESARTARRIVEEMRAERAVYGYDRTCLTTDQKKDFAQAVKAVSLGHSIKANEELISEVDSRGGYLLPTEVASAIQRIARTVGLAMSQAQVWTMNSDELAIPAYTGSVLTGEYLGLNAAGSITSVTFKQALLQAKKWQLAFALGNDLLDDSPVNLSDWLMALAGEALANMIDRQVFNGGGNATDPFTGILRSADVTAVTLATGKDTFQEYNVIEDSSTVIGNLEESLLDGAAFYMSKTVWANLRVQKDDTGNYLLGVGAGINPILVNDPKSPSGPRPVGEILGFPVYTNRHFPALSATAVSTKFIAFGNMKTVAFGNRGAMKLEQFTSGTFGSKEVALADQRALVFKHRHAVALTLPEAFAVVATAAS